jgi:type I restriction enzyme S subunit
MPDFLRVHQDYKENLDKYRVVNGDLLIAMSGATTGKIGFNTTDQLYYLNQRVGKFEPQDGLLKQFLFYFLLTRVEENLRISAGAAQPNLSTEQIKDFEIQLPSLPEQQRIVGILDEAFEGIATAKANAEKNLQNAHALFDSHHHSIFAQMRDGWEEKPLGEVCEYVNGKAHEQCIDKEGRYIVINSKFISSNGEVFKRSDEALLLLQPGDIAMVLSDVPNGKALAKCFLVEKADTYTLNQRICLIRSKKLHTKFLFYQLNRNRHFLAFDNGENQTNMRLNQILSCPLFLPPIPEQKTIAAKLDVLKKETQHLESIYQRKFDALEALKKSLLNQAFDGEL